MILLKKTVYDKLIAKVNNIDIRDFVLKAKYETDKKELENKISDTGGLAKKADYNTKVTKIEIKIPSISGLATKTILAIVENKIPNISILVKKIDYDTDITEIEKKLTDYNHDKYITNPEFNTQATKVFNARLVQAKSLTKTDFEAELSSINKKITANKSKQLLVPNELKKLKTFDSSHFIGKSHFEEDYGTEKYLVFQSIQRYHKPMANTKYISEWKSKGLCDESIKPPSTSDDSLSPLIDYGGNKIRLKFNRSCLKQPKLT